jgi:hypothetical protein
MGQPRAQAARDMIKSTLCVPAHAPQTHEVDLIMLD